MAADTAKRRVQCAKDFGALQCVANAAGVVCFICSPLRAREPKTPIVLALSAARNILIYLVWSEVLEELAGPGRHGQLRPPTGVARWARFAPPDEPRSGVASRNVLACARHDTRD